MALLRQPASVRGHLEFGMRFDEKDLSEPGVLLDHAGRASTVPPFLLQYECVHSPALDHRHS